MKVGDILICHRKCFYSNHDILTVGKEYEIIEIDKNDLRIISDDGLKHWFPLEDWAKETCQDSYLYYFFNK